MLKNSAVMPVTSREIQLETPSSRCWERAQEIFLTEIRKDRRISVSSASEFLHSRYRIDTTIDSCLEMKSKVDNEYGSKKGRFASKLLDVLRTVKDVGDAFLEFAPESVSIAWSAVSILIKVGTDDIDKCEMISACCENIVMIVLNCRLYENRFSDSKNRDDTLQDIEQKIMDAIPNLLYLVLDFSWYTNQHLDKNRLLRSFKECFSNTLKGKIESLTAEYQALREIAQDAFQEIVMRQLSSMPKMEKNLELLRADLFPVINDLTLQLDHIEETLATRFKVEDIRANLREKRSRLDSSQTYLQTFLMILEPIRHEYRSMSNWLFNDQSYRDWENPTNGNARILCLKGPRGYGKSVKMTCIIKRLMDICIEHNFIVLFFYFTRNEEAKYTIQALRSLLSQLLDHRVFNDDIDILEKCAAILETSNSHVETPEGIAKLLRQISALAGRPIYVAIDAIDECEDRNQGRLADCLKIIVRSSESNLKVICSSRDNVNIESLLCDGPPREENSSKDIGQTLDFKLPKDTKIIPINEETNSEDLRLYLSKKIEPLVLRRVGGKRGALFLQHVDNFANIIFMKAKGNFSYATMIIANLQQPTKSTLEKKILQLPSEMEGMYRRGLKALKPDEQELVIYVLKWVVWGLGTVSVLEVLEHYKQIYHPEEDNATVFRGEPYDPYSDPEIADTRYHLYNAGRDFFQFDMEADTVSVHLSVKEWIESESKNFAKSMSAQKQPVCYQDETGAWVLKFTVPDAATRNYHDLGGLEDGRGTHLELTTEILYALNNQGFQNRYRPWNPPKNIVYNKLWDKPWHNYPSDPDLKLEDEIASFPQSRGSFGLSDQADVKPPLLKDPFHRIRYEIRHLAEHFRLLQEEWKPEERKGALWEKFWEQFRSFVRPRNWRRWGNLIPFPDFGPLDWSQPHYNLYRGLRTPISAVAEMGFVFILDYVVESGIASVEDLDGAVEGAGLPPIHTAATQPEFIRALIRHGANVDLLAEGGDSPLEFVLWLYKALSDHGDGKKCLEAAKSLILAGAKMKNDRHLSGCNAFLSATSIRDLEIFHMIYSRLDKKYRIEGDSDGNTPMHHLFAGDIIGSGSLEERGTDDLTAYSEAGLEILHVLLRTGIDINIRNSRSESPLLFAASQRDLDGIKWLLEFGADVNAIDADGDTCFHKMLNTSGVFPKANLVTIVKVLSQAGLNMAQANHSGETALSIAVEADDPSLVQYILDFHREQSPSRNDHLLQQDASSRNLLHRCASNRENGVEIARMIIEILSEEEIIKCLNLPEATRGLAPLHVAAESLNTEMIKFLLDLKADVSSQTFDGKTALDVAIIVFPRELANIEGGFVLEATEKRCEECIVALMAASPGLGSSLYDFPIAAVKSGSERLLKLSINNIASPLDILDEDGWTLFHAALYSENTDLLRECLPNYSHDTTYNCLPDSKKPTCLSSTRKGPFLRVSEDGLETWQDSDCAPDIKQLIISDYPISGEADRYYFEVTVHRIDVKGDTRPSIGLQTSGTWKYDEIVGYCNGVGFSGHNEFVIYNRCGEDGILIKRCSSKNPMFSVGSSSATVGCGFDIKTGRVFFTLNGDYLGVGATIPRNQKYYPAVSVCDTNCRLRLNFGCEPFIFKTAYESFDVLGT